MILTGMGPVERLDGPEAKVLAIAHSLVTPSEVAIGLTHAACGDGWLQVTAEASPFHGSWRLSD